MVPIGNRIKAISLDKTDDFEDFHVFIPNFQEFGFKDRIAKESFCKLYRNIWNTIKKSIG